MLRPKPETTPTPWNLNSPDETLILGPDRQVVATTFYDTRAGDAGLIVRAVNVHDEAMAVLREAYAALAFAFNRLHGSARSRDGELCNDFGKVRGRIEAVLKKSGGTP